MIKYPETENISLDDEFFHDDRKIPDQLRFRDETLFKAVAALEAKADSDEPKIQGAIEEKNRKASDRLADILLKQAEENKERSRLNLSPLEKRVEEVAWELEILESEANALRHMIKTLKESVVKLLPQKTNPS